jgi:hypothetical protein
MGPRVMSAKEFREYATECMEWAKSAKTDHERDIFLQMAKTWMEAAVIAKERDTVPTTFAARKRTGDQDDSATA